MIQEENVKQRTIPLVEVFTTSIQNDIQAEHTLQSLAGCFPELKMNFDLNETDLPYPCGHTILRVEGDTINSKEIISIVNQSGFKCDVLEDKVCK